MRKTEPDVWSIDQRKSVTIEEFKKTKSFSHLSLIRQNRLSVIPIDSK